MNNPETYTAVDAKGSFTTYEGAAPLGDGILYGDTLFEGEYHIKGIKKMSEEKMKKTVVNCLCHWAYVNREEYDFETSNYVEVNKRYLEFGDEYTCSLEEPIVEVKEA